MYEYIASAAALLSNLPIALWHMKVINYRRKNARKGVISASRNETPHCRVTHIIENDFESDNRLSMTDWLLPMLRKTKTKCRQPPTRLQQEIRRETPTGSSHSPSPAPRTKRPYDVIDHWTIPPSSLSGFPTALNDLVSKSSILSCPQFKSMVNFSRRSVQ